MSDPVIDLFEADSVELRISADDTRLWVHIDGVLRVRVYRIARLVIDDDHNPDDGGEQ